MSNLRSSRQTVLDLPNLPADQLAVLRHILRKGEVAADELEQELAEQFTPQQLADLLNKLLQAGFVTQQEQDGLVHYRGQLSRRSLGNQAMKGVWDALDFDQHESVVNPQLHRTRSPLTDRLLANLDTVVVNPKEAVRQEPLAGMQSLMDDLLATGRTAMEKYNMAPQENPHNDENADSLMNDLLSAAKTSAKKPEPLSPTPTPPAQPRRLSTTDFASIPRTREEEEAEAEAQAQAEANLLQAIPPVVSHDEGAATVPHVAERPTAPAPQEGMVGKILRFFGLNKD